MFTRVAVAVIAIVVVVCHRGGAADPRAIRDVYGSGVHAYFAGDPLEAERALSTAIDAGSRDPRAYYFRALVYLGSGRTDQARVDLAMGGALEVEDVDGAYPVSESLERVQGRRRQILERYRRTARTAAYARTRRRERRRYEALRRNERDVLRRPAGISLDDFAPPARAGAPARGEVARPVPVESPPTATRPKPPGDSSSVGDREATVESDGTKIESGTLGRALSRVILKALPDEDQEKPDAGPVGEPTQDPFGDDPFEEPAGEPARERDAVEEDPFGDAPSDTPQPESPADETDPFGDAADDAPESDAPGASGSEAPPEEKDPFGDSSEDDMVDDDPFADG